MAFVTKTKGGGSFVKMAEFVDATAFLVEPVGVQLQVPNPMFPQSAPRDVVTADVTIFQTLGALDGETEPTFLSRAMFDGVGLTRDVLDGVGDQFAFKVALVPNKKGGKPFPAWRDLDKAIAAKVQDYYTKREAGVAAAMSEDLPTGFDF